MDKRKTMIRVLRDGLLEIRIFSQESTANIDRVNSLAELLHNIPDFIWGEVIKVDDFDRLAHEIAWHKKKFPRSLLPNIKLKND